MQLVFMEPLWQDRWLTNECFACTLIDSRIDWTFRKHSHHELDNSEINETWTLMTPQDSNIFCGTSYNSANIF